MAQQALDEWVTYYNTERPHQALGDAAPVSRFHAAARTVEEPASQPEIVDNAGTQRITLSGVGT